MILVGNQRGGAKDLALHLLKEENDHVQVHELRGFASDNLTSALNEAYAVSRGTQCKQFLFSLSINPPPDKQVTTEEFEATINRAEAELGLTGQPRAIVFHEKAGPAGMRRHAHAVWSRINADEMKAIQLSHTKHKLTDLSREIFIEREWKMPRGLMRSGERDMRRFSFDEWQQAKRNDAHPHEIRRAITECWAVSDSRAAFEQALESRGYKLARGDRRGFVAIDMHGQPYAIAKWADVRTKKVRERLGELDEKYPGVEDRKREFAGQITQRLGELGNEAEQEQARERTRAEVERKALVERQRAERATQAAAIQERWNREAAMRQERFNRGLRGLFDRLTGQYARIRDQNIADAHHSVLRDRAEKDALIFRHLDQSRAFDVRWDEAARILRERAVGLNADRKKYDSSRDVVRPIEPLRTSGPSVEDRLSPTNLPRGPDATGTSAPDTDRQRSYDEYIRKRTQPKPARGPRRDLER